MQTSYQQHGLEHHDRTVRTRLAAVDCNGTRPPRSGRATNTRRSESMTALVDRKHLIYVGGDGAFVSHGSCLTACVPEPLDQRRSGCSTPGSTGSSTAPRWRPPSRWSSVRELIDAARGGRRRSTAWSGPSRPSTTTPCTSARPHEGEAQNLHGDAIIDVRTDAFDVQLMYYPQEVTARDGRHAERPRQPPAPDQRVRHRPVPEPARPDPADLPGRHRACSCTTASGTAAGATTATIDRYMFKIRFNPTVRQVRLWNTDDLRRPGRAQS